MISQEDSINELSQIASNGSRGAFHFLRWIYRRAAKSKLDQPSREADRLMTDACSRYRGGYCHPENEQLTQDLLSDLSGGKAAETQPFFFLGDRSDLSVFWQVTKPEQRSLVRTVSDQRVVVPREMIDKIPDDEIRKRTLAAFTKARADGLVSFDGKCYSVTETGKRTITRSDFILSRLEKEYKFFTGAEIVLNKEAASEKETWIDVRLKEHGIDPGQYADCRRITVDKASLHAERHGEDWIANVPGTSGRQKIILPSDHVVEADERMLIAFIDPNKVYDATGTKAKMSGSEILSHFEDKTEKQTRRPSAEAIRRAAEKPDTASKSSFNRDDFFEAAIQDSLRRHGKTPGIGDVSIPKFQVGDTVYAPDQYTNSLKLHEYRVSGILTDAEGQHLYKLSGEGVPDQIVPESAQNKFLFTDRAQGEAYLSAHSEEAASYADELLARTMGERFETTPEVREISVHTLTLNKDFLVSNNGESCQIRLPGKQVEKLVVPTKDVLQEGEHLQITLRSDQSYKVLTGAYSYNVFGDGAAKLSGAAVQSAKQTVQISRAVGNTAAATASAAATGAAQTAVNATVAAIPVPEPITMGAKTIYAAASQAIASAAQTAAQTAAQSAPRLVQTVGKE